MSREAPVLILKYDATEMVAGGAGNAANNVAALGGRARLAGLVGTDAEGRRLLASFHRGVDKTHVVRARRIPHADQDAHSRRRRPLGEAAGRPHRSRGRLAARRSGERARSPRRSAPALERLRRGAAVRLRIRPGDAGARRRHPSRRRAPHAATAGARAGRLALPPARLPRADDLHAERVGGRAGARLRDRRRSGRARAGRTAAAASHRHAGGARHARQPRHGAVPAEAGDDAHADLRLRRGRRRHRRRRHGDRDVRPRAGGGRVVLRSRTPGQLRRRTRRHEARHGDRLGAASSPMR